MNNTLTEILEITIENFRSFLSKEKFTLSDDGTSCRPVTAVVGANASGKSNIAIAMQVIKNCIKGSTAANFRLPYDPFAFQVDSIEKPTSFGLNFRKDNTVYSYYFQFDETKIIFEELRERQPRSSKFRTIFRRDQSGINPNGARYGFSENLLSKTRKDSLLVTKAQEDNNIYSQAIFDAVNSYYVIINNGPQQLEALAARILAKRPELKDDVLRALSRADFPIRDLRIEHIDLPEEVIDKLSIPEEIRNRLKAERGTSLHMGHYRRIGRKILKNNAGKNLYMSIGMPNESMGTRAFFSIVVPIIDAIYKGKTLYIDEFGIYLHPDLAAWVIDAFYANHKNSKLIVNTHVGSILDSLSRKSIIFVSKDPIIENSVLKPAHKASNIREGELISKKFYTKGYENITPKLKRASGLIH